MNNITDLKEYRLYKKLCDDLKEIHNQMVKFELNISLYNNYGDVKMVLAIVQDARRNVESHLANFEMKLKEIKGEE